MTMQVDLFGKLMQEPEVIRTLCMHNPYCTAMLYDKEETRWVRKGRVPGFRLGKYILYSSKGGILISTIYEWSGWHAHSMMATIGDDPIRDKNGCAIVMADLVNIRLMTKEDEAKGYVTFHGEKEFDGVVKVQWILEFRNRKRIEPFEWKWGKQGPGIFPEEFHHLIQVV